MNLFLSIAWSSVGLKVAQLLLSLSILVILHEFGHYITAKWFKCRVEKFYLFFNPWFSLFKKKIGETEYGIGWLPLGGYVKISGMVDESMDKEQMKQPPQEWEFRSKPAWQRLIIMIGGVTVNVLLAILIYSMILFVWGDKKLPTKSLQYGISFNDPLFTKLGFKNGDKILAVDGKPVEEFNEILRNVLLVNDKVTIERNGVKQDLQMPEDLIGQLIERKKKVGLSIISPRVPVWVYSVDVGSEPEKAGLRKNDKLLSIDSVNTEYYDQYQMAIQNKKKGDSVQIRLDRSGQVIQITSLIPEDGRLGFYSPGTDEQLDSIGILKYEKINYGFFESFPAGFRKTGQELSSYILQFKKIVNPSTGAIKGVGGFKAMGSIFSGNSWDWYRFWSITALFSIILAFMNLLPIPALDGGHVLFTLYEMITGRKPSDKFLEYAQIVGMVILLALMLFANWNDWFGWGK